MDADDKNLTCRFPLDSNHRIQAQFDVVIFKVNFITPRDRPDIDKLLEAVRQKN